MEEYILRLIWIKFIKITYLNETKKLKLNR